MGIEAIYIVERKGTPVTRVESANAVAGQGIEGDRYFRASHDDPGREITLIESEAIDALTREYEVPFDRSESRRNLVTKGVPLNHLVGREFRVGPVRLKGIRLCEPCGHLEALTRPGVRKGLIHRGGLRAQILVGGTIRVGDSIDVVEA